VDAILNWLWQGCALAAAAAACIRLASRATATTRYALWWIVLLLVLLLPVLPSVHFRTAASAPRLSEAAAMADPAPLVPIPAVPSLVLSAIGFAWALGTLISLGRTALDLVRLARARRSARPFPEQRESKLRHWCAVRGGGRRARVVTSGRVRLAAVLGFGEPLIAISPAAARALSDEDLDRVLVHEWAHVQRHDDWARLGERLILAVAGAHPAVWWIARRLAIEREVACDDHAVNVTGAARDFARCLTRLAQISTVPAPPALVPGALVSSQLSARVVRLLDGRRNTSTRHQSLLLGRFAAALIAGSIVLASVELFADAAGRPDAPAVSAPVLVAPPPAVKSVEPGVIVPAGRQSTRADLPEPARLPARATPTTTDRIGAGDGATSRRGVDAGPVPRLARSSWDVPALPATQGSSALAAADLPRLPAAASSTEPPWGVAADAGVAIGRGSQKAGEAAADVGTSIGKGSQKAGEAAADAGTSIGKGSQKAAVATAGFFSKMGRRIAGGS
jgi:beta-lactamase regulating signal transducer with metallopeptidase domain